MGATAAITAAAKIYQGYKTAQADRYSADLLNQEAGQSVASGIQGAIMARRRGVYVASNARARTAASGLATTSPTAIANVGQIRGQAEYGALTQLYQGEDRAEELQTRAGGLQDEARASVIGGWLSGAATGLSGGAGFFAKYGQGYPSGSGGSPAGSAFYDTSLNPAVAGYA